MTLGFGASVMRRLVAGLAFVLVAGALVWQVERPRAAGRPTAATVAATAERELALAVESTCAVAQWRVRILGIDQPAEHADRWSWRGTVRLGADSEILVQALPEADVPGPHRCLRIRLGSEPDRLAWGGGDMIVSVMAAR